MGAAQHLDHKRQAGQAGEVVRFDHQGFSRFKMTHAGVELLWVQEHNLTNISRHAASSPTDLRCHTRIGSDRAEEGERGVKQFHQPGRD